GEPRRKAGFCRYLRIVEAVRSKGIDRLLSSEIRKNHIQSHPPSEIPYVLRGCRERPDATHARANHLGRSKTVLYDRSTATPKLIEPHSCQPMTRTITVEQVRGRSADELLQEGTRKQETLRIEMTAGEFVESKPLPKLKPLT